MSPGSLSYRDDTESYARIICTATRACDFLLEDSCPALGRACTRPPVSTIEKRWRQLQVSSASERLLSANVHLAQPSDISPVLRSEFRQTFRMFLCNPSQTHGERHYCGASSGDAFVLRGFHVARPSALMPLVPAICCNCTGTRPGPQ
jgi:hypothetical protein